MSQFFNHPFFTIFADLGLRRGEDVAVESLISLTNKARAEAMIAEAVAGPGSVLGHGQGLGKTTDGSVGECGQNM